MIIIDDEGIMHDVVSVTALQKMTADINGLRYSHMFNYVSNERVLDTVLEIIEKYANVNVRNTND